MGQAKRTMGATRRKRNQEKMDQMNDKMNEAAERQKQEDDLEGYVKARDKVLTYTRRTDDLTANWQRMLIFSSGCLALVIMYTFLTNSDLSMHTLLAAKLAAATATCSGIFAWGVHHGNPTHMAAGKWGAVALIVVQGVIHQVWRLRGDWLFVVGGHFGVLWWCLTFATRLNNNSARLNKTVQNMVHSQ